jgi:hypothetical protein
MTTCLIELRDYGITVRSADEVLARSPGYASIAGDKPLFGEDARRQSRLHPRHTFNQFWAQLALDPLPFKNRHFRHAADLAYGQLDGLTRALDLDEVVIAAPGSYSRAQLGVLLGIVRQCKFKTVGLGDLALLQAAGSDSDECVIIDLQLHQALLSRYRKSDGHLLLERTVPVQSSGLIALQDAWLNMISEAFIDQTRFDPQRNAEAEQYLVNQLPAWIATSQGSGEVVVEINLKGSVQQVRLTYAQFEQRAQPIFARIAQELAELRNAGTALHVSAGQMNLPGLLPSIPGLIALDDDATMRSCLQYLDQIRRTPETMTFVSRVALNAAAAAAAPVAQPKTPTHVLINHRAVMLPPGRLTVGTPPPGLDSARIMPLTENGFSGAIALLRSGRGLQLEVHSSDVVLHNGKPAASGQTLVAGDMLQLGSNSQNLHLIIVEQGV